MPLPSSRVPGSKMEPEAFVLSGIGGCIDAIGILTLGGLFVSHMSGNTAALGAAFGQGQWQLGLPHLFAVPVFVIGLFLGYTAMAHQPTLRRCACVLLTEALLLALFGTVLVVQGDPAHDSISYFLIATPPLLAMGLQNSTLREVGRSIFPSTYVTGVIDAFGKAAAHFWLSHWYRIRGQELPAHFYGDPDGAMKTTATIWFSYVSGALVSSAGLLIFPHGVVFLPVAILLVMAARFWNAPTVQPPSEPAP